MKSQLFFLLALFAIATTDHAVAQSTSQVAIRFFVADRMLEPNEAVTKADLTKLNFKILTDGVESPDVKYQISWRMYLRKGSDLGAPIQGNGLEVNAAAFMATANPGDALAFEVDHLTRTNADGKREQVALNAGNKYLSVPVKK